MTMETLPADTRTPAPGPTFQISFDGVTLTGTIALRSIRDINRLIGVLNAQKAAMEDVEHREAITPGVVWPNGCAHADRCNWRQCNQRPDSPAKCPYSLGAVAYVAPTGRPPAPVAGVTGIPSAAGEPVQ